MASNGSTKDSNKKDSALTELSLSVGKFLGDVVFPNTPGLTFKRKLLLIRFNSNGGACWDVLQLICILVQCCLYFASTYPTVSYNGAVAIFQLRFVITQVFMFDFALNWFLKHDAARFLFDWLHWIDIMTMIPSYLELGMGRNFKRDMNVLQCLRILRVSRILRTFKFTSEFSTVRRQITELCLTLVCLVFLAAATVHLTEGSVKQEMNSRCNFSTALTGWRPSCSPVSPSTPDCNCIIFTSCASVYSWTDIDGSPTSVSCQMISFFQAVYFIVITTFSVGYGDIAPTTTLSKMVIIFYVLLSLVIFPMRISELQKLLTNASPFSSPFLPQSGQRHVIITGATDDKKKLERVLRELFHPDRTAASKEDLHAVILAESGVPSEEMRSLIGHSAWESKVTWIVGSALVVSDLKKARADSALAMFFLCNPNTMASFSTTEDASTVLQALSVSNFNMELEVLVQLLRPESSKSFIENDISVVLCLDEFKTLVQARNAAVPGFSTLVENLFHSFGSIDSRTRDSLPQWYHEYLRGAGMELYFTDIPLSFIRLMRFSFKRIATAILLEFDCIAIGVSNEEQAGVVFNPIKRDLTEFVNVVDFYTKNHSFLIMADDQDKANDITKSLEDPTTIERILQRLSEQEILVPCGIGKPAWASVEKYSRSQRKEGRGAKIQPKTKRGLGILPTNTKDSSSDSSSEENANEDDSSSDSEFTKSAADENDSDDDSENGSDSENYIGYNNKRRGAAGGIVDDDDDLFNFSLAAVTTSTSPPRPAQSKPRSPQIVKLVPSALSSDSDDDTDKDHFNRHPPILQFSSGLGRPSEEIKDSNVRNHIIVSGCDENLALFIHELRRPAIVGHLYHPIVIVAEEVPKRWSFLKDKYNDVFFLKGSMSNLATLRRVNAKDAFSLTILAARNEVLKVDDQHVNPASLLVYLAIESNIPKQVHISVEMSTPVNIAVMNATVIRRERENSARNRLLNVDNGSSDAAETSWSRDSFSSSQRHNSNSSEKNVFTGTGTFATRRKSSTFKSSSTMNAQLPQVIAETAKAVSIVGSAVGKFVVEAREAVRNYNEHFSSGGSMEEFWDAMGEHHVLPVFASGTAYLPSVFESLLVSNWYSKITPLLCERFIVGQGSQTFSSCGCPKEFVGRQFMDLFRVFLANDVLCIGVFRAPTPNSEAVLPYVYLSPTSDARLASKDSVYVFGTQKSLSRALFAARSTF